MVIIIIWVFILYFRRKRKTFYENQFFVDNDSVSNFINELYSNLKTKTVGLILNFIFKLWLDVFYIFGER